MLRRTLMYPITYTCRYGMSFHKSPFNIAWRVSNVIQIPIGLAFVAISFLYVESPRYLLEKRPDNPERVLQTLARLRSGHPEDERVRAEFHELVASYEYRKKFDTGYMAIFRSAAMRKRLLYGFYATSLQQFGVSAPSISSLCDVLTKSRVSPPSQCTQP